MSKLPRKQAELLHQEYAQKMREACVDHDLEGEHVIADNLLCELLRKLGYNEIVDVYESLDKWYA